MLKSFKWGFFERVRPGERLFRRPLLISIAISCIIIRFSASFVMVFVVLNKGWGEVKIVKFTVLEAIVFHVYLNALRFHILI